MLADTLQAQGFQAVETRGPYAHLWAPRLGAVLCAASRRGFRYEHVPFPEDDRHLCPACLHVLASRLGQRRLDVAARHADRHAYHPAGSYT